MDCTHKDENEATGRLQPPTKIRIITTDTPKKEEMNGQEIVMPYLGIQLSVVAMVLNTAAANLPPVENRS